LPDLWLLNVGNNVFRTDRILRVFFFGITSATPNACLVSTNMLLLLPVIFFSNIHCNAAVQKLTYCSQYSNYVAGWTVQDSRPGMGEKFFLLQNIQTDLELTQPPIHWVPGVFPGEKVARVPSTLPSAEVKNDWTYASTPLKCCHGLDRENFTLCCCVILHDFQATVTLLIKQVTEIQSSAHCSFMANSNNKNFVSF